MTTFVVEPIARALSGRVSLPGDKSIGHRALLFGSLCERAVEVSGLSGGQDNARTRAAMEAMGVTITDLGPGRVRVHGVGVDGLRAPAGDLDCGNSGTSMRLLAGLLAGQRFAARLFGDESLSRRPMRRVAEPLRAMGAAVEGLGRADRPGEIYPPLIVRGGGRGGIRGIDIELAVASAQVKSAILLAGLYADGVVRVREPGPSRDHTECMLAHLGAPLVSGRDGVVLDPVGWDRRLSVESLVVPGDPSSAAFLVAAGLVGGASQIELPFVCLNPTRTGFLDVLVAMGAPVATDNVGQMSGEPVGDLVVSRSTGRAPLRGATIEGHTTVRAIDEIPVLAVVAAMADGVTHVRDAAELRVKESDRVATTCDMLRAFGVEVEERPDGFSVTGQPGARLRAAHVDSRGDHRIAMAAVVGALAGDGPSRIDDVDNVATSFPGFAEAINALAGAEVVTRD